jgi:hypothetical protein
MQRVLPVPYFHVVFTLPCELNALCLRNPRVVYGLLFDAASRTLLQAARNPEHLGAQVGITAVLHTWGQNLMLHPHAHCVVTSGGLSADGTRWVKGRPSFLLPVKVLARLYRGKMLAGLQQARDAGELAFDGATAELADPARWATLRDQLYRKDWVVYAKRPFGGPEQVLRYLGRYTHRVAISNNRITAFADGRVTFSLKDYTKRGRRTCMTLDAVEFLRRFCLHVLPSRFVRIRHYGLLASRNLGTSFATARSILSPPPAADRPAAAAVAVQDAAEAWWERFQRLTGIDVMRCPHCGGRLVRRRELLPLTHGPPPAEPRAPPTAA